MTDLQKVESSTELRQHNRLYHGMLAMTDCPNCGSKEYRLEVINDSVFIVCPCGTIRSKTSI